MKNRILIIQLIIICLSSNVFAQDDFKLEFGVNYPLGTMIPTTESYEYYDGTFLYGGKILEGTTFSEKMPIALDLYLNYRITESLKAGLEIGRNSINIVPKYVQQKNSIEFFEKVIMNINRFSYLGYSFTKNIPINNKLSINLKLNNRFYFVASRTQNISVYNSYSMYPDTVQTDWIIDEKVSPISENTSVDTDLAITFGAELGATFKITPRFCFNVSVSQYDLFNSFEIIYIDEMESNYNMLSSISYDYYYPKLRYINVGISYNFMSKKY